MPPWKMIRRCRSSLSFHTEKEMVDINPLLPTHFYSQLHQAKSMQASACCSDAEQWARNAFSRASLLNAFSEAEGGEPKASKSGICCITLGKVIPGERLGRLMGPLLIPAASRKTRLHLCIEYLVSKQDCIKECLVLKAGDTSWRNDL